MKIAREKQSDLERDYVVAMIAWFVELAHSKWRNRFSEAARAQTELERLGVRVRFRRRRKGVPR